MATFIAGSTLTTITCSGCGGVYAIAEDYRAEAQRKGGFQQCWHCPYCDEERGFGEGEVQKLKAEVQRLTNNSVFLRNRISTTEAEAEHFRKSRDATKGALTKIKGRIACGVCPCCRRNFKQLAAHMKTKHPDYSAT